MKAFQVTELNPPLNYCPLLSLACSDGLPVPFVPTVGDVAREVHGHVPVSLPSLPPSSPSLPPLLLRGCGSSLPGSLCWRFIPAAPVTLPLSVSAEWVLGAPPPVPP